MSAGTVVKLFCVVVCSIAVCALSWPIYARRVAVRCCYVGTAMWSTTSSTIWSCVNETS